MSVGIGQELAQVFSSPPTTYSSVEHYLHFVSQLYTYATRIEPATATQLYKVEIRVTLDGCPYIPTCRLVQTCATFYTIQVRSTIPPFGTVILGETKQMLS